MEEEFSGIRKELSEAISDGQEEIYEEKKVVYDKTTKQFSIKIPKGVALKAGLKEDSEFSIVFNPKKEETKQKINKTRLIIFLKDGEERGD